MRYQQVDDKFPQRYDLFLYHFTVIRLDILTTHMRADFSFFEMCSFDCVYKSVRFLFIFLDSLPTPFHRTYSYPFTELREQSP